jgi:hemerythrin
MASDSESFSILVVDDEASNLHVINEILKSEGYHILAVKSGKRALEVAKNVRPALILLDIMMPEMNGYEVCLRLKDMQETAAIPVIFVTAMSSDEDESKGLELGAVDYITKPVSPPILKARVRTHLALANQNLALEALVSQRTVELHHAQDALREAMNNLRLTKVSTGVYWLQVPEAGLFILCGCPAEVVKHLMRKGYIASEQKGADLCETGPNAILLSELPVHNGILSNMAEFPVLQMLYRQGMMLPGHPNNTGVKPLLIGSAGQLQAQLAYIHRGNYGLLSREEILSAGVDESRAEQLMQVKLHFAFGTIHPPEQFIDTVAVDSDPVEIRNGVTVSRVGFNRYQFHYRGKSTEVDLNLNSREAYEAPYTLDYHIPKRTYFGVLHSGEGDGWDVNRPSMSSILMFDGDIYLIDAPPNIDQILRYLGIDISEVRGVFHTHAHDDHFAGLPILMRAGHRLKYFTTPLVRAAVTRKFSALLGLEAHLFERFFEICDLQDNTWNDCGGFQVKPVYSPHPVENSLFMFRAPFEDGYRTYAHWADLTSFDVLDKMASGENDLPGISGDLVKQVKADYLEPACLKKLDVGGGLIHGQAEDFRADVSRRIVLAHIDRELTDQEKEIGSAASFGALDVLIDEPQVDLRRTARRCLATYFPDASEEHLESLLDAEEVSVNAGAIIRRRGEEAAHVDLILTGRVQYIDAERQVSHSLSIGAFVGEQVVAGGTLPPGTWRAESHVTLLRIPGVLLKSFLDTTGLGQRFGEMVERIEFVRHSWLFGEQLTPDTLNHIALAMKPVHCPAEGIIDTREVRDLFLVAEGSVVLENRQGIPVETLQPGDFFGEQNIIESGMESLIGRAVSDSVLLRISEFPLVDIPIVHWKLRETAARRSY